MKKKQKEIISNIWCKYKRGRQKLEDQIRKWIFSGFVQKYNMLFGILVCALFTSILWELLPLGAFFVADIYLIVGNCIGLYFTFKNRKETHSVSKNSSRRSHSKSSWFSSSLGSLRLKQFKRHSSHGWDEDQLLETC